MLERGFAETVDEILAASFNPGMSYVTTLALLPCSLADRTTKPQMLLFSATVPFWVCKTASRYMSKDRVRSVELTWSGREDNDCNVTAVTVEVCLSVCLSVLIMTATLIQHKEQPVC